MLSSRPLTVSSYPRFRQQQDDQPLDLVDPQDFDFDLFASEDTTQSQSLYTLAPDFALPYKTPAAASPIATHRRPRSTDFLVLPSSSTSTTTFDENPLSINHPPELMPSETSWALGNQYTSRPIGRLPHQRESSLSSLGSAGPASPYNHSTPNPQIAITDSANDHYNDAQSHDGGAQYYQLSKAMNGSQEGGLYSGYHAFGGMDHSDMGYPVAIAMQRPRTDKSLLPAPEFPVHSRSHPTSVASSTAGGDSPATPTTGEPDDDRRRRTVLPEPPKLDRTMTDIYSDELYSPSFNIVSASSPQSQLAVSPNNDVFAQRLQAANSQHLNAVHSPTSVGTRDRSPFRHGSPLAPGHVQDFTNNMQASRLRFNSAHNMREQDNADRQAQLARQQLAMKAEPDTPKTISPKDAMLEYQGCDADSNFPSLFPQPDPTDFGVSQLPTNNPASSEQVNDFSRHLAANGPPVTFPYMAQHLPASVQIPQHYPFIAHAQQHQQATSQVSPAGSSSSSSSATPAALQKPAGAAADGGTYTCTYHGCTLRFETPALLQKHKREGHRQPHGLGMPPRHVDTKSEPADAAANLLNSQAGPHRCDRINPSTGKSCNTIFSRPYDLTRHEDTIHNARKQKVRCDLCSEEKTFSRADALTRHYRVCHPDVEFPAKYRRRGNHI
ncbi:hypothetical protein BN1723_005380 [Verticillium longisporum]|uniref:C2H2-type domain-containing protein n=2 Tax=Verticillium longisporum TaxID=100787 RepID=A0A0G4N807_VERLO|nr:hypothetical protein BN1723_005380 [Verticillium longisporum]